MAAVVAVTSVDAVVVVVGTSSTAFGFLHKATPFGTGVLEPNLMEIK